MNALAVYKVNVRIEPRDDGGLRAWSEDLPELVLSHADANKVMEDIPKAMEVILSHRLGAPVRVEELSVLPPVNGHAVQPGRPVGPLREFAARAA